MLPLLHVHMYVNHLLWSFYISDEKKYTKQQTNKQIVGWELEGL